MGTFNVYDPNDIYPYGQSIVDGGICVSDAVNGYGLLTFGFLWQVYDIWLNINQASPITTTWTPSQFGTFGDPPP